MANEVQDFLSSWKQLSLHDKSQLLSSLKQSNLNEAAELKSASKFSDEADGLTSPEGQVYDSVKLSSYYSYLYYYPTMHWSLDRPPETDHYWIGMFREGASNSDYVAYQWLGKVAQGSYYVGKVEHTYGALLEGYYLDQYELRIFRDKTRLMFAKTNEMRGSVIVAPTDVLALSADVALEFEQLETDRMTDSFMQAIESVDEAKVTGSHILKDFHKRWNNFTLMEKQLLCPVLKHSFHDEKKNPALKLFTNRPEPKVLFPDLDKVPQLKCPEADDDTPTEIVLNITLGDSYTYVYPQVEVTETVGTKCAFVGMYHIQSTSNFDPDKYIDNDWQWVGKGQEGTTTELNYIEKYQHGQIDEQYLGVIFDKIGGRYVQLGYANTRIETVTSVSDEMPPADFKVDFDKEEALTFAYLSQLAYEDYSVVQQHLPTYGFKAEMEINKGSLTAKTVGFIASNDTNVVVAFRGTELSSLRNLLTDAWFEKCPIYPGSLVQAHSGFVSALELVYSDVVKFLKTFPPGKKLYITGHSLGGALASLLGYRLVQDGVYNSSPIQYVYGCPPVGEPAFANSFNEDFSNTITIPGDPISTGTLVVNSELCNIFKPNKVKCLPRKGGHPIAGYINQLNNL